MVKAQDCTCGAAAIRRKPTPTFMATFFHTKVQIASKTFRTRQEHKKIDSDQSVLGMRQPKWLGVRW
jgi:hypothetical protein